MGALDPSEKPNIYPPAAQMMADTEYKKEALEYVREQRALLDKQSEYTSAIKWATWLMAIATVVIALATVAQYVLPLHR
jgi:cell division protein FtsX